MMNKNRLEAFTDGMIAIIVTLLVLEMKVPEEITVQALLAQWHTYFAYITSYIVLYGTWYNHHGLFEQLERVDVKTFWLNGMWILTLSFIPYVTEMVGDNPYSFLPEFLYLLMNLIRLLVFQFLAITAHKANGHHFTFTSNAYIRFSSSLRFGSLIASMILSYWFPLIGLIWTFTLVVTYIFIAIHNENTHYFDRNADLDDLGGDSHDE